MSRLARAKQLLESGAPRDCIEICDELIRKSPRDGGAHHTRALALARIGHIGSGHDAMRRAIAVCSNDAKMLADFAQFQSLLGRPAESVDTLRRALQIAPDDARIQSNLLYMLMFDPRCDGQAVFEQRRLWGALAIARAAQHVDHANDRDAKRRLRVGYVSAHLRMHAVNVFLEPIILAHDDDAIEVFCYSAGASGDEITGRLRKKAAGWRDIWAISNDAAAQQIVADNIDILVDIDGHMGPTRVELFARKPAPVQVSYLGDQATTGLSTVDWRMSDAIADPVGAERLYTEKLYRMPEAFFAYQPWAQRPPIGAPPSSNGQGVLFGSFNHSAKLSEDAIATWARLLQRVPGARLGILVHDAAHESARLNPLFAKLGIVTDRVMYASRLPLQEYLALIERTDIALDSLPFSGHTTTSDCLSVGVPVVTRAGETYARRMSASVLHHIGCDELIAQSADQYVDIAAALAQDVGRLERLRHELPQRMAAVTDARKFTAQLEAAFREMWQASLDKG